MEEKSNAKGKVVDETSTDVEVLDAPQPKEKSKEELLKEIKEALGDITKEVEVPTKTVILKATPTFIVTPKEVQSEAYVVIASPMVGRAPYIPLSAEELVEVSDKLFGFSTKDTNFTKEITDYFSDYRIKVEYGPEKTDGKKLILPVDEKGNVIFRKEFVDDIIAYRVCLKTGLVAKTSEQILEATSGDSHYIAYLYDAYQEKSIERRLASVRREADKQYLLITEPSKEKELNWLIRIIRKGIPINDTIYYPTDVDTPFNSLTIEDKQNILRELRDKYPAALINLAKDQDLEMKAMIETAIDIGLISRSKGIIKYGEDVLGSSVEDAVLELKNPRSSQMLINLKSSLAVASKL